MVNLMRDVDETERDYIWRIGQAKENGEIDATWEQLLPTINNQCERDVGESVWRKMYAEGKEWEPIFSKVQPDEYIKQLREDKQAMLKERVRLRDERIEYNKLLRESARNESLIEILQQHIDENDNFMFQPIAEGHVVGNCDLLIQITDWHIGAQWDSYTGKYNSTIAARRINDYLHKIIEIQERHGAENAYVAIGGDMISGAIHNTTAISNRENVVEQVMLCAELVSAFLLELCRHFNVVNVIGVGGNHTRLNPIKEEAVLGERLDTLILWYAKAKLGNVNNICVNEPNPAFEGTLDFMDIRNKRYCLVHGDIDPYTQAGISKIATYLGGIPYAVLCGHLHEPGYQEPDGIVAIRSGSLGGSGDDYTIQKRLAGNASQTVCVCDNDGVQCMYPVKLA